VCLHHGIDAATIRQDLQPACVQARRVDVELIFRNLIDNAIKYAGTPPAVSVEMQIPRDGRLRIRVTDNGRGIPRRLRRRIFGRFVRLGSELERDKQGTGLGLYIVHTLVRQLRGRIRVLDPPQGPGTVFEIDLPTVQTPPTASPEANRRTPAPGHVGG
jgi:signal transduction histidine kinase